MTAAVSQHLLDRPLTQEQRASLKGHVAHRDHVEGVAHVAVGHLGDMHQPILVHADIDEGAKRRDIGHSALQPHARFQVGDFGHPLGKAGGLEGRARVAAGFLQLGQDIAHRRAGGGQ